MASSWTNPAEGYVPLLGAQGQRVADARQQVLMAMDVVQAQVQCDREALEQDRRPGKQGNTP